MKHLIGQKAMAWFIIGLVALFLVSAVHAQEGVSVMPSSLNITGKTWSIESRTIVISANESVTGLNFTTLDLMSADGKSVIHQQLIQISGYETSMEPGTVQHIPVTFNFGNVTSGSYSGEIWLTYTNATTVKIPVTVTLQDDWNRPALILVFAVLVSYALFVYGSRLKQSDEIRRTHALLKRRFDEDNDLKTKYPYDRDDERENRFYVQINADLQSTLDNLDIGSVSDAQTFLKNAQTNWTAWKLQKQRLLDLFPQFAKRIREIIAKEDEIKGLMGSSVTVIPIIAEMKENLQAGFNGIINDNGQKELINAINSNGTALTQLGIFVGIIKKFEEFCKGKDLNACPPCKQFTEKWTWDSLKEITKDNIEAGQKTLNILWEKATTTAGCNPKDIPSDTDGKMPSPFKYREVPTAPSIVNDWALRLLLYDLGSFFVAVAILAMAGFFQLYLSNPTFGSLADYLTLALWGLMAGPSADAITTKAKTTFGIS
jgi:hypothetical protein